MAEIDTLQVKITANAKSATESLNSLAKALGKVKTELTGMKDGVTISSRLAQNLNEMNGALNTITTSSIKKLQKLANALDGFAEAAKKLKGIGSIAASIKAVEKALSGEEESKKPAWKSSVQEMEYTEKDFKFLEEEAIREQKAAMQRAKEAIRAEKERIRRLKEEERQEKKRLREEEQARRAEEKAKKEAQKARQQAIETLKEKLGLKTIGTVLKTFFRIAAYRAIRAAIKAVSEAFSEGLKNAYAFSKQTEGFERLAKTLDRVKSITYQMTNQLGAFWGEVKQFVLPVIEWLVEKVRYLAEKATEFFAALNGEHEYLFAKYVEKSWDDATDSIKEYKQQLLGLDELNVISTQTKKTEEENPADEYELRPVNAKLLAFATKLKALTLKIGDLLPDWSDLQSLTVADIEALLIPGLLGLAGGLVFHSVGGAVVGTLAGIGLQLVLDSLLPADYNHSNVYDEAGLAELLIPALGLLAGSLIGFTVANVKGCIVGASIGATLGITLNKLLPFESGRKSYKKKTIYSYMESALTVLAGSVIGWSLGKGTGLVGGVKRGLIGAAIGAILTISLNRLEDFANNSNENEHTVLSKVVKVLKSVVGVASAATTGYSVGSIVFGKSGGLLGASVASILTIAIREFTSANESLQTGVDLVDVIVNNVLCPLAGALAGGVLGFLVTKTATGALVGATLGMTLTCAIRDIIFKNETPNKQVELPTEVVPASESVTVQESLEVEVPNGSVEVIKDAFEEGTSGGIFNGITKVFKAIGLTGLGSMVAKVRGGGGVSFGGAGTSKDIVNFQDFFDDLPHAHGGIVKSGELFVSGEVGSEIVGKMGSNTAVANTGQMTDAIYKAAYMGMSQALKEHGGNGMSGWEPATTDDLFVAMKRKASNYNKRTGSPAFA